MPTGRNLEDTAMNKLLSIILASAAFISSASSLADESVAAIPIDEILANAAVLDDVQYVSTGQPDEETLSIVKHAGFSTVIDMRREAEDRGFDEAAAIEALEMEYVLLPVAGASGVTFENAATLNEILGNIDGPVLLHCASGNRVGALMALRASLNGSTDEEALAVGKAAGLTRLEPVVIEKLQEE